MIAGILDVADHLFLEERKIDHHIGLLARGVQGTLNRPAGGFDIVTMAVQVPAFGTMGRYSVRGIDRYPPGYDKLVHFNPVECSDYQSLVYQACSPGKKRALFSIVDRI